MGLLHLEKEVITMTNSSVEAMIALRLIQAQTASDKAKFIKRIPLNKKDFRPCKMGYDFKQKAILEAIRLIRTNKTSFNYYVEEVPDQNGIMSILVYFDFKIKNKRYQISFHNHNCENELKFYVNTGRKTHWHKNYTSYYSCIKLQEFYKIPRAELESENEDYSNRRNPYSTRRRRR